MGNSYGGALVGLNQSRHGVQHGRTESPNTKTEIVRLLNTLETALALHELLRDNQSFSIKEINDSKKNQPAFALIRAHFFLPRGEHRVADASSDEAFHSQAPLDPLLALDRPANQSLNR